MIVLFFLGRDTAESGFDRTSDMLLVEFGGLGVEGRLGCA